MTNNVVNLPIYGEAISLEDEGIYFLLNASNGKLQSIFQLVYEDEWYIYQLTNTAEGEEPAWSIMAEKEDYRLVSMSTTELSHHFSKSEYAEPRGAWQVIRNSKYGFAKFTPADKSLPIGHAMLMFKDDEMLAPIRIHKADEETLRRAEQAQQEVEVETI